MLAPLALVVSSVLVLAPYRAGLVQEPAAAGPAEPEEEDPWAQYEEDEPAPAPAPVPQAAPAPGPAPAAAPPATAAATPERPRKPSGGVGLLVGGPVLIVVGIPFSFWGNQVFREGCLDDNASSVGDEISKGFGCGLSATGSFLLHGLAFLLYAGGAAMVGGGGLKRGRHNAWEDAFETREPRNTLGHKAGGAALLGISAAALIGSRVGLWVTLDNCAGVDCVQARQRIASSVAALSVMGIASGAALLAYGVAYDRRLRRWAPDLALLPTMDRRHVGFSLVGRF